MKYLAAVLTFVIATIGAALIIEANLANLVEPVDSRPAAGTIKCRDLQVKQMGSMVVTVDTDPFTRDYSRDDRNAAAILDAAETLQKLCK